MVTVRAAEKIEPILNVDLNDVNMSVITSGNNSARVIACTFV
jgi:hypothetical protein